MRILCVKEGKYQFEDAVIFISTFFDEKGLDNSQIYNYSRENNLNDENDTFLDISLESRFQKRQIQFLKAKKIIHHISQNF